LLAIAANNLFDLNGTSEYYSSSTKWYDGKDQGIGDVAKARFIAYFANGSEKDAEALLEKYNVKGGLAGLDFSASTVKGDTFYLSVKYTMDYEFNFFNVNKQPVQQSAKARLWK
jgi:hypothetical protein